MSSFDYNAPAELFLAKTAKGSRTSIDGSQQPLRPSVTLLRLTDAQSLRRAAGGWDDASAAAKSNACTIRCASLGDRRHAAHAEAL
jgi:hypothetical protein